MKFSYNIISILFLIELLTIQESSSLIKETIKSKEKNCNQEDDCYEYSSNNNTHTFLSNNNNKNVDIFASSIDDEDSFNYVRNINCTYSSCPSPNYCIDNTICKCGEYRANIITNNSNIYCQYKTKLQLIAILLELIFPGIGHIYLSRSISGIIKMLISILTIYFFIYTDKRKKGQFFLFVASMISCIFLIYYIVDIYLLFINEYKDGNDVPLASFF